MNKKIIYKDMLSEVPIYREMEGGYWEDEQTPKNKKRLLMKLKAKKTNIIKEAPKEVIKGCNNCRYSAVINEVENNTYCLQQECIKCNGACEKYKKSNESSIYISKLDEDLQIALPHLNTLIETEDEDVELLKKYIEYFETYIFN